MDSKHIYEIMISKCSLDKAPLIKLYIDFITSNTKNKSKLTEDHHILPKALHPEYRNFKEHPWNKVTLHVRDHLKAHKLLADIYGSKMIPAYHFMLHIEKYHATDEEILNFKKIHSNYASEKFKKMWTDEYKALYSEKYSGENNNFYGKKHTTETIEIIRQKRKEQVFPDNYSETMSKATSGEKNGFYGKTHTPESIEKMKESLKDRVITKKECPHCKTSIDPGNYKKYHGDNCKYKVIGSILEFLVD